MATNRIRGGPCSKANLSLGSILLLLLFSGHYAFLPTRLPSQQRRTTELQFFRGLARVLESTNGEETANGLVHGHENEYVNGITNSNKVPFVIERLGDRPKDDVFKGIADMCISVFFNDGKEGRALPPWKEVQLSYLRMIQMADLRRRRTRDRNSNAMFVAYKVEEASPDSALSQPLILNMRDVNNLNAIPGSPDTKDYVRGEILGFCEVSMVPFGLVPSNVPPLPNGYLYDDSSNSNSNDNLNSKRLVSQSMRTADISRPVLTNLAVKKNARSSGVGSKLMAACERTAASEWGKSEIVLEVEDDNLAAQTWYQKRGYRVMFSDPTSRRYDVSGLFLRKVDCTRQILRKSLNFSSSMMTTSSNSSTTRATESLGSGLNGMFRRLLQSSN